MRRLSLVALLFAALPAAAGDIVGYVAGSQASIDRYDRFPSGIGSPTPNTAAGFVGAGLDLSGIGWMTGNPTFAVSLLAAVPTNNPAAPAVGRYVIGANHVGLPATVTFADNQGVTHSYSVVATQRLTTGGVASDLIVGRLAADVPTADGIRPLPLADVTAASVVGLNALAYGQKDSYGTNRRQLGLATLTGTEVIDYGGSDPSPTETAKWDRIPGQPGSVQLVGGDSGGPLIARGLNGETALVGVHNAIDGVTSYSSFVPRAEYVTQLNAFMGVDGYRVLFAPVPEPAGLLAVGLFGCWVVRDRRRVGRCLQRAVPGRAECFVEPGA